jgi:peptide/nickel transport system permease protein
MSRGALETGTRFEQRGALRAGARHLWVVRRLVFGVVILFIVSILIFVATQALPGNAATVILGRLGTGATPEGIRAFTHQLGLDRPVIDQYGSWLGGVLTGNLGTSLANGRPVASLIGPRAANSAILVFSTAVIAIPLSIVAGAIAAMRRDRLFDKAILFGSFLLTALPEFVIGLALVILLATTVLTVLPAVALFEPGANPLSHIQELVLPVLTLALAVFPYVFRLVRASTIDALESEYVEMARLKGMPDAIILRRHALPNAIVPAIQGTALSLAYLTGGIVVVEFLFRYPGLGTALTDAISNRDLPTVQAIVLIFATAYVGLNIIADLLTVYFTPSLRG